MDEVIKHPWVISGGYEIENVPRMEQAVQVSISLTLTLNFDIYVFS